MAALAVLIDVGTPHTAQALAPVITLGKISMTDTRYSSLRSDLQGALEDELAGPEFAKLRSRERYVISARLMRVTTAVKKNSTRASCSVSLVLHRRQSDALFAVIDGRATAENDGTQRFETERTALRAAVHGAMRRVPAALTRLPR